jgi:hypothetical protein
MNERWNGLAGIAFAACAAAGAIVFHPVDQGNTNAAIIAHYASTGGKAHEWIGAALILLSLPFLLWFLATLRSRLAGTEGGSARLANLAFAGGTVFAGLVLAGFALMLSPTVAASWTPHHYFHVDPNVVRVLLFGGQFMVLAGAAAGGSMLVLASSLVARRTQTFPQAVVVGGYVVAPMLLLSIPLYGIPLALLLLWIVVVSASLARTAGRRAFSVPATA